MAASAMRRPLSEVLKEAQPCWTARNLTTVEAKLADIGIESSRALAEALQGKLNERLRNAGHKTFALDTLHALKCILGAPPQPTLLEPAASQCDNESVSGCAVDEQVRDILKHDSEAKASSELRNSLKFQYLSGECLDLDLADMATAGEARTCIAEALRLPYERVQLVGLEDIEVNDSKNLSDLSGAVHVIVSADPLDEILARAAGVADMGKLEAHSSLDLKGESLEALPERLGQLRDLTNLDLSYNKLERLPGSFGKLTALVTLDLSENRFSSLPEAFSQLAALEELDLKSNMLRALPANFGDLGALKSLNAMYCELQALPSSFCNLAALKKLNCMANELTALPDSFGELRSLTAVNLSNNALVALPESFCSLESVVHLQLARNQLTALPQGFGNMISIHKLDLGHNQLQELPRSFGSLRFLSDAKLPGNNLQELPDSIGQLSKLFSLSLAGNQLRALPQSIVELHALGTLDVRHNPMSLLPKTKSQTHPNVFVLALMCKYGNLQHLTLDDVQKRPVPDYFTKFFDSEDVDLTRCALRVLPEAVSQLKQSRKMLLGYNGLKMIPSSFFSLEGLCILDLSHNSLAILSESLGRLKNLEQLDLSHNLLARLPEAITKLSHLKRVSVANNQLTLLPERVGQMVLLVHLELQHNWLTSVPESVDELLHLEYLDLRCNPFQGPHEEFEHHPARRIFYLMNRYDSLKTLLLWPEQEGKMPTVVQMPPPRGGQRPLAAGPRLPSNAEVATEGAAGKRRPFMPPLQQDEPRKVRQKGKCGFLTGDAGLHAAMAEVQPRLESAEGLSKEEKQKIFKELFLEWHPDKNPGEEALATRVFQWLQEVKDRV